MAQKRRFLKLSTVDWQVLPQFINTLLLRFYENFIIKIFIKIWLKPYSWWTYSPLSLLSPSKYSVDTSFIPVLARLLREKSKQNRASKYFRNKCRNWHGTVKGNFPGRAVSNWWSVGPGHSIKARSRERERKKNKIYTHKIRRFLNALKHPGESLSWIPSK